MKRKVKEMEEEAGRLKDMQVAVEKEMANSEASKNLEVWFYVDFFM